MDEDAGKGREKQDLRAGVAVIAEFAATLPRKPGVYRMYDAEGNLLYVGKARDLKARVSTYARGQGHTNAVTMMLAKVARMECAVTGTEAEALLLEANLIKRLKPRYNVLLRDDKSFPYILIAKDHPAARLSKHRGARRIEGSYYGPFANAGAVNRAIDAMQKAFLIRSCSDSVYANRTRPCLLHQIRRCAAPCTGEVSIAEHDALVRQAEDFLSGRSHKVQAELTRQMEEAAQRLDYETAAVLRDRIAAMAHIAAGQGVNPRSFETADVFALAVEGGQACIQVYFYRAWQNWGNQAFYPRIQPGRDESDILAAFVAQFYDTRPAPPLILLSHQSGEAALLEEALSERAGCRVRLHAPRRGEKRQFVQTALANAREALGRRLATSRAQGRLLEETARAFGLPRPPRRIEVYDNSHIQGAHAVGAMIAAGPEGFMKAHYRKFNIKDANIAPGDDFAMMREVMRRRFSRLVKDKPGGPLAEDVPPGGFPDWPDLVLVDGGRGQLNVVLDELRDMGVAGVTFIGVAKGRQRNAGREEFHLPDGGKMRFERRDPVLYYLQRLRDEAHRFAIGTHRKKRSKETISNPLDEVPGIGPARKRALLAAFGSAKAVSRAAISELAAVDGISEHLARAIYDYFR